MKASRPILSSRWPQRVVWEDRVKNKVGWRETKMDIGARDIIFNGRKARSDPRRRVRGTMKKATVGYR